VANSDPTRPGGKMYVGPAAQPPDMPPKALPKAPPEAVPEPSGEAEAATSPAVHSGAVFNTKPAAVPQNRAKGAHTGHVGHSMGIKNRKGRGGC
jgi:hypothetical protein